MRLQEEGAEVIGAGLELKPIHGKNGLEVTPSVKIETLHADDLFALVLPGGWAPDKLRRYSAVTDLVREMDKQGKIIGIICHGGLMAVVGKIRQQPELMDFVREKLNRSLSESRLSDSCKDALREWQTILSCLPLNDVLDLIMQDSDEGQRLRHSTPFSGILSQRERLDVLRRHEATGT